ncbi:response regulator [Halopseudomonas aestusnigri]|jgi:diguanylate cyclase (GGDEF)-like protein|uniref:GGDEF domain-containing response regulator n=1 Tax=Halopseudomonas TaxID=2901189 RepID=UPI000C93B7BB|nr:MULTISPECIES: response regulator [Halopseudomonas]MAK73887.1 diguanylate cyclase [Pseudomonadales bacterium]MEE2798708.1 response regulator [Pseudomonadota bacterium]HCP03123.1 diguanylate cyclase [Pseudomonas sp.]MAP77500.1 diguanylate cyclase [Pseudomonadales bacterium]MAS66510.1 diguanylate cyclase [Pseudomonadales bacterium]|tara:strand:- start:1989 stop:2945 length:957 start_codon:yes stop_codon:yes gene_type:complete
MPNPQLSILVVDDTKFSSAVIGHTLSQAGYSNIRFASSAMDALRMHEEQPASVMVADWLMPEMDGLELTTRIRQTDEQSDHYTYVVLLTAREGDNVLGEAFDRGVDDFISKSSMNEQLLPRIYAADRTSQLINRLLDENRLLATNNAQLEEHNLVDRLTAIGNRRYLIQRLADVLRNVDSRGGACCLVLLGVQNLPTLTERFGPAVQQEVLRGTARRLQQLVRPTDVVARVDENAFAIVTIADEAADLKPASFRRLHDGLNLKAFKTSEGYLSIRAGMVLCTLTNRQALPDAEALLEQVESHLGEAYETNLITEAKLG